MTANGEKFARDFVTKLFANVPVLDGGGRGATTTFTQRVTSATCWSPSRTKPPCSLEEVGGVTSSTSSIPSLSASRPQRPVAVVGKVVDKRGTRKAADRLPRTSCSRRQRRTSSPGTISAPATRPCSRSTPASFPPGQDLHRRGQARRLGGGAARPTSPTAACMTRSSCAEPLSLSGGRCRNDNRRLASAEFLHKGGRPTCIPGLPDNVLFQLCV
jgi:hypothetical protein